MEILKPEPVISYAPRVISEETIQECATRVALICHLQILQSEYAWLTVQPILCFTPIIERINAYSYARVHCLGLKLIKLVCLLAPISLKEQRR